VFPKEKTKLNYEKNLEIIILIDLNKYSKEEFL